MLVYVKLKSYDSSFLACMHLVGCASATLRSCNGPFTISDLLFKGTRLVSPLGDTRNIPLYSMIRLRERTLHNDVPFHPSLAKLSR